MKFRKGKVPATSDIPSRVRPLWLRLLAGLVFILFIVGLTFRAEIARLHGAVTLFDEDRIVANFSSMGDIFQTTPLPRGDGPVSALPTGSEISVPPELRAWFEQRKTTSLIVLHDGAIVFEEYYLATGPDDLRISWSLAKSWLSVLLGIVLEEGFIESIDDTVIRYAPELAGSAYEEASIRDVLTMQSGVAFDEDYMDFWSDVNRMGRVLALGGNMDEFAASFTERASAPGQRWTYVSIDTHVIGMVIRGATGRSIPDLIREKIVVPLGLEADGYFLTDSGGTAFALGGLNFTSRDYARFASMVLAEGVWNGRQIVSADWLAEATRPQANTEPGEKLYGFQWWIPVGAPDGEFQAEGIYGQYIYFDRTRDVAIVMTAADREFRAPGVDERNTQVFRDISHLVTSF